MISESFSHAYVSAMVRAGEALGHGKLFEFAQNEYALVSTMIPYDIFTDETGAWEEPCKTDGCFPSCLGGDDLLKRAHARAMFHKSLRKLQDRHTIRGGVPDNGPYPDSSERDQKGGQGADVVGASAPSRPNLKRRYSSIAEPPPPPGTGSAKATSWAVYDPKHTSEPLDWPSHHLENKPYGRHRRGDRLRSLSVSLSGGRSGEQRGKKGKKSTSMSLSPSKTTSHTEVDNNILPRSTHEINWGDVAGIFQRVELPRRSSSKNAKNLELKESSCAAADPTVTGKRRTIFAPFCRKIGEEVLDDHSYFSSDDEEEDMSDEMVLANHQIILDEMKTKVTAFIESRKKQQERRKLKTVK